MSPKPKEKKKEEIQYNASPSQWMRSVDTIVSGKRSNKRVRVFSATMCTISIRKQGIC